MISLIDTVDSHVVDLWLVFRNLPREGRWWRWLKQGFQHVECWCKDRGAWARIDPCLEFMRAEVHLQPPWEVIGAEWQPTFFRVTRLVPAGKVRDWWAFGPVTCVELTKAVIGLRAPLVRTPYQLYKHLRKSK